MKNPKKQKLEIGSSSQSQRVLTPREKLYQETLIIEQQQKLDLSDKNLQKWHVQINGLYYHLNNINYLNFCFQKTQVLLKESKNFYAPVPIGKYPPPVPISKTIELRYHIFDLEELLEPDFTKKFKFHRFSFRFSFRLF